jgi:hypothetical protein
MSSRRASRKGRRRGTTGTVSAAVAATPDTFRHLVLVQGVMKSWSSIIPRFSASCHLRACSAAYFVFSGVDRLREVRPHDHEYAFGAASKGTATREP